MPRYRPMIVDYLAAYDDGAPTTAGTAPEQAEV
jgi:hypothetical protein